MLLRSKKFIISLLISCFLLFNTFAVGTGAQVSVIPGNNGVTGALKGSIRSMRFPVVYVLGLEAGVVNNDFNFGISGFCDYWILDMQLKNTLSLYAGPGIAAHMLFDKDFNCTAEFGSRIVAGINWVMYDHYLEYYAQCGVEPGVILPLNEASQMKFNINFPCEIGLRVHF